MQDNFKLSFEYFLKYYGKCSFGANAPYILDTCFLKASKRVFIE